MASSSSPPRAAPDPALAYAEFGPLLRFLRRRAGLTQAALAAAVGYSPPQISLLEHGRRQPNPAALAAQFVPALGLAARPEISAHLLNLASAGRPLSLANGAAPSGVALSAAAPLERAPAAPSHKLPVPLLPLLGREHELAQASARLMDPQVRLLTLLGPPGVGKTRLALALAQAAQPAFRDGACLVDLASLRDPAWIAGEIRQALGLAQAAEQGPESEIASITAYLHDRELLLVLDNVEQVLGGGGLVADLLAAAPGLKVLATSRAALQVYGEHKFVVPPLALPDLDRLPPPDELARCPSIALFVARAQAAAQDFTLTAADALPVAAICVRLDGLPLALELAAAHVPLLGAQALADRLAGHLSGRLATLTRGPRNRAARQQTLRGALEWSYHLLGPAEQVLFARLAVFAGGFTLAAVEAVCGQGGALASLVDASLVHAAGEVRGARRFALLETLREYAAELLAGRGELDSYRWRHAEHYTALAEAAEAHLLGPDQAAWLDRLAGERENLRAALDWLLAAASQQPVPRSKEPGALAPAESGGADPETALDLALRLCVALWRYWRYRCELAEGYHWLRRCLAPDRRPRSPAWRRLRARAAWGLGLLAALMHQEAEAQAALEESLLWWRQEEDAAGLAGALTALGMLVGNRGETAQAVKYQSEALDLYASVGDELGLGYAHNALGETLRRAGDLEGSRRHYQASLLLNRRLGHQRAVAVALGNLGQVELALSNLAAARACLAESLSLFREIGDPVNQATVLMALAGVLSASTDEDAQRLAAQLFGFGHRVLSEAGARLQAADQIELDGQMARLRQTLGAEAFEAAWAAGRSLTFDQAHTLATSPSLAPASP